MKKVLTLAIVPLLLLSFAPISANAQQSNPGTVLQFVETVYAHSGSFTMTKSALSGTLTNTITVDHHGDTASVQERAVIAANGGSSQTLSQSFTITDKSTNDIPDYVVDVPSANLTVELTPTNSYFIIDPTLSVSYYVNPTNGGYASTSTSPSWACGASWSLDSSSPPLSADWSGPHGFLYLCFDPASYWYGTLSMSDTGGFAWSGPESYSGSYVSYH